MPSIFPSMRPPFESKIKNFEIKDPDSMILSNDLYFPLLLAFLKDERVPIKSMELKGLNWFNFLNPSAFRLALGPFLHICKLDLESTTCSKYDMKCLITSLPKLARLFLVGCKLQGEGGPVTGAFPQGPTPELISIDALDGEYGVWDFLISPESPVSLYALIKIFITVYRCVQWWTATFLALPPGTQFERVTIEIAVDQHRVKNGSTPLPDSRLILWKALDEALCRPEVHISELHFYVHAKLNPESMYLTGYNYSGLMHWLFMHRLPRCRAKYESDFMLADEAYEEVDVHGL